MTLLFCMTVFSWLQQCATPVGLLMHVTNPAIIASQ